MVAVIEKDDSLSSSGDGLLKPDSKLEKIETFKRVLRPIDIDSSVPAEKSGVPLLCHKGTAYVDDGDSHTLIFGATGSKKTRLMIMPAIRLLAKAGESFITTDPKSELFDRTSGDLKLLDYEVHVINFRNPKYGDGWNPLSIPYTYYLEGNYDRACEFVNDFVNNIIHSDPSEQRSKEPYWDNSASDCLTGLILLLFKCAESIEQVNMRNLFALRHEVFAYENCDREHNPPWIKTSGLTDYLHNSSNIIDSLIHNKLSGTFSVGDITRNCILSVMDQYTSIFSMQTDLLNMMSKTSSSFKIEECGNKKMAIFVIMPDEKTTYHKLVSLFIKQSYEWLISTAQKLDNGRFTKRINFLLDEFANLPKIPDFSNMISASRSRNIRFTLVAQGISQLESRYGKDAGTIKGNCNNWVYLASREVELLKELSLLCGEDSRGKPIFSISRLQRLDKDKGEALILYHRLYPYCTRLADINEYDYNKYSDKIILPSISAEYISLDIIAWWKVHEISLKNKADGGTHTLKETDEDEDEDDDDDFDSGGTIEWDSQEYARYAPLFGSSLLKNRSFATYYRRFLHPALLQGRAIIRENIFHEAKSDEDICKFVDLHTKRSVFHGLTEYAKLAENYLMKAIFLYLYKEAPPNEQNLFMVVELLDAGFATKEQIKNSNETDLDRLMQLLARKDENHCAVRYYQKFRQLSAHRSNDVFKICRSRFPFFVSSNDSFYDLVRNRYSVKCLAKNILNNLVGDSSEASFQKSEYNLLCSVFLLLIQCRDMNSQNYKEASDAMKSLEVLREEIMEARDTLNKKLPHNYYRQFEMNTLDENQINVLNSCVKRLSFFLEFK